MTGAVRVLRPGEAVPIRDLGPDAPTLLTVSLTASGALPDMVAMLVSDGGKVRTDDDLVFYNNPASLDSAVSWNRQDEQVEFVRITPGRLDSNVDRVVLGCAGGLLDASTAANLTLTVFNAAGTRLATSTFPAEPVFRAMILFEAYRRHDQWRCRLLAQGYARGLAALVTDFGVQVAEDDHTEPALPPLPAVPAPPGPTIQASKSPAPPTNPGNVGPAPYASPTQPWTPSGGPVVAPATTSWQPFPVPPLALGAAQPWQPPARPRRGGLFTSRKRAQLETQNAELTAMLIASGQLEASKQVQLQAQATEVSRLRLTAVQIEQRNAELNELLVSSGAMDKIAVEADLRRLAQEVRALTGEVERRRSALAGLEQRLNGLHTQIAAAEGELALHDVGIYRFRHRLDDSIAYKGAIAALRDKIKDTARRGSAVRGSTNWTVDGSIAKGRTMVNEVSKLMLRAYNADADHAVRTMRAYKLDSALTRLDTTRATIARLGKTMNIQVSDEYHRLRRQELELTADYLSKVEEEKERQRQLREDQREQQRAEAEYQREQDRLERDRHKYSEALTQLEARGETQKAVEIRSQLTSVNAALAGLAQRRANLRLGHVYVISNIGAFGKRMVKIGMTRRLDPMDRVRELGDASVPFRFDVHALIFSEDAVVLETALHRHFAAQRVNQVNTRREFFYVTPAEVRDAIAGLDSQYLIEYKEDIDAPEWRQSGGPERALLPT